MGLFNQMKVKLAIKIEYLHNKQIKTVVLWHCTQYGCYDIVNCVVINLYLNRKCSR